MVMSFFCDGKCFYSHSRVPLLKLAKLAFFRATIHLNFLTRLAIMGPKRFIFSSGMWDRDPEVKGAKK